MILNENNYKLEEMATVGRTDDSYEVIIFTNDPGNIPHFHYRDVSTHGKEFHTCIRLDEPEYFHHDGKEGILNSKQKKELVKFLRNPHRRYKNETNWQHLVYLWNDENNSSVSIDENIPMPDYLKL